MILRNKMANCEGTTEIWAELSVKDWTIANDSPNRISQPWLSSMGSQQEFLCPVGLTFLITSCLGPKMQFLAKTQHTQRKTLLCDLCIHPVTVHQKILENKVVQKLKLSINIFYKKCTPKQMFLIEKENQTDSDDFWLWKFTIGTFGQTDTEWIHKTHWFPLSMFVFGQKSSFLGPRQLPMQKVNIHYLAQY